MNIYAMKGHRVVCRRLDAGYIFQIEKARQHLKVGEIYTIDRTKVYSNSTDVILQEIPGVSFNSVCFDDAVTQALEDTCKHPDYIRYKNKPVIKTEKVTLGQKLRHLLKNLKRFFP